MKSDDTRALLQKSKSAIIGSWSLNFDTSGTLRREILDAEWFVTTKQAQSAIKAWLKQYNHIHPHQALNMRPPVPETLLKNGT